MQVFAEGKVCPAIKGKEMNPKPLNKTAIKIMRVMKLTAILLTVAFLQVNANGFSQTITYSGKNVPLQKVFSVIKEQAGFGFIYFDEQLKDAKNVTISVKNAAVEEVLAICMKGQPYDYTIKAKTIFIKQKKETTGIQISNEPQKGKIINISGKVTGEQGEPVVGATITVKGTDVATSTNERGVFVLNEVDEDAVLVVTNVSYQSQEIALRGRSSLDVQLKVNVSNLEQTVVVAYATTTARHNTGSVSVLKGETIQNLPNRSIDRSLQGYIPGLQIVSGGGLPGGGISNIVLRGVSTGARAGFGSSARNPLIIIDGVQISQDFRQIGGTTQNNVLVSNPLSSLNPSDIASISVLKDAAAIGLYGTRASNGVIIITTKNGKAGKMRTAFRHQFDIANEVPQYIETLNQDDYLELLHESYKNRNTSIWSDNAILTDLRKKFAYRLMDNGDTSFYNSPSWSNELYRKNAATVSNEISFSGGTDRNNYYLNLEYLDQDGIIKETGFNRSSIRFNFSSHLKEWLNVGINSTFSYTKQNHTGFQNGASDITGILYSISPLNPIRLENGDYNYLYNYGHYLDAFGLQISNPAASLQYNINRNIAYKTLGSVFAEVRFLKRFRFKSIVGGDFSFLESKQKIDPRLTSTSDGVSSASIKGQIKVQNQNNSIIVNTNSLYYDHKLNANHEINVLIAQEAQLINSKTLYALGTGLADPSYEDLVNATNISYAEGTTQKERLLSYFGQLNYNYKAKYFLTGNARRDGSSKFGSQQRFGNYWSVGAGWIVSEESFMKKFSHWLDFFKVRGSIGASGNTTALNATSRFDLLALTSYNGNTAVSPQSSPGNSNIRWEETFNKDLGVELRLLRERLSITFDVYSRKTYDLISSFKLPSASGYSTVIENIGDLKNRGIELSLSADLISAKDFKWNLRVNWSKNSNKLTKANVPFSAEFNIINKVGEPYNSFYLKKWAGVNQIDGKPLWVDSTEAHSSIYSAALPNVVGKTNPDGFGSIIHTWQYRNFELTVFFYYQYGYQIYDQALANLLNDGNRPYSNSAKQALDRWQKPGDVTKNPRNVLNNTDNGSMASTRYLFDGDYIRLRNISASFLFPKAIVQRLKVDNLKVSVQANNVALWSKYDYGDPDNAGYVGEVPFAYPQARSYSLTLNVGF